MRDINSRLELYSNQTYLPGHISKTQFDNICCVQSCGKFVCLPSYLTDRQGRNSYLMLYVISGKCFLDYNGEKHVLGKGRAFMIDCNIHQIYGADKHNPCTITFLHFAGGNSKYYYDKIVIEKGNVYDYFESSIINSGIAKIFNDIANTSPKHKTEKLSVDLSIILTNLLNENVPLQSPFIEVANFACDCIKSNTSISVDDMANHMGYSKYYFTRKFTDYYKISPYAYIVQERLELCKNMLLNTDYSIGYIADLCGFNDNSHMTNCFKQNIGSTPSEYRKQWQLFKIDIN